MESESLTPSQIAGTAVGPSWVDVRQLPVLAMFGTLWTVAELQLGNQLHWARVPFAGAVLTAAALFVLVAVRRFVPRRGSVASVALVVAALKLGLGGPGAPYAALGILLESLFVEALLPTKHLGPLWASLAGAGAMSWCFVHPFLTQGLLAGSGILKIYALLLQHGAALFGLGPHHGWYLFAILWGLHALTGLVVGIGAWHFAGRVQALACNAVHSDELLGSARLP